MTTATTQFATGTWTGDPVHSDITFTVQHATLIVGPDGAPGSRVTATIDAASVRTGNDQRDNHIRSADFLGDTFVLVGDLALPGVTRSVEPATGFPGVAADPSGVDRTGFSATTSISRAAFGVDIRLAFGAGNVVVGDTIGIAIEIPFTSEAAA